MMCGDGTGSIAIDHVLVSGRTALRVGETVPFAARAFDSENRELTGQPFTWSTTDSSVATVNSSGVVSTISPGQATITASASGKSGTALLSVTLRPVTVVQVTPTLDSLDVGDSLLLVATLRDSTGNVVTGRLVAWRTSDTTKATVTLAGLVRTRAAGGFAVVAECEGTIGGAFLTAQYPVASLSLPDTAVVALRQLTQIIPDLRGPTGVHLAGRSVSWTIGDPTIAQISGAGVVTPIRLGATLVSASCCTGLADTSVVIVQDQPTGHIVLQTPPSGGAIVVGESTLAQVELRDQMYVLVQRPVTWFSRDTTIMRVIPDTADSRRAYLHARRPGPVLLTASSDGVRDSVFLGAELPVTRLLIEPDTIVVRVGSFTSIHPTLQDSAGGVHFDPYPLAWTVINSAVASVDNSNAPAVVGGLAPGSTMAIGTFDYQGASYTDTVAIVVYASGGTRLEWNMSATFAARLTPLNMTLSLVDSAGNPVPIGQNVMVTAGDTNVVSVTPALIPGLSGNALVTLHPKRAGTTTVVARTDSIEDPLWVRVIDIVIGTLAISPPTILNLGDSLLVPVSSLGEDAMQRPYPLTWTSSDSSIAIVNDTGVLIGVGLGYAQITVASAALRDTASVMVESLAGPTLDSITPTTLLADGNAIIYGGNFDPDPIQNRVTVDGIAATVTGATTTRLDVRLPPTVAFPCTPTRSAAVTVQAPNGLTATTALFSPAHQRALAVGESVRLPDLATAGCNELAQTGGAYEISVVTPPTSAGATTNYQLKGTSAGTGPTPPVVSVANPEDRRTESELDTDLWAAMSRERSRLHHRILEESRRLVQRAGPPAPLLRARTRPPASTADSVGNLVRFRVPNVYRPDFCASYTGITARRAYAGVHLDIYEDLNSQVAGRMDTELAQLGQEFDTAMYPELLATFGDPLVLDSLLDRNGKIVMVVTPVVNPLAAGFVVSCDFYPESVAPSSNTGEIFYAFAPTNTLSGFAAGTVQNWFWLIRSVTMHESKHVTALAERLSRGAQLEETWLEEGSAVVAEELWARGVYGIAWKGDAHYQETLFCDVRPTFPQCAGRPFAMFNAFALLYDFADGYAGPPGNEGHTPLGPTDPTDASFYGSAWSLLRWTIDQYATSEAGFLKPLVQDPTRTGVANLEARAGRSYTELSSRWLLASVLAIQTVGGPEFTFPSWRLRSIFIGMNADFPSAFPIAFPYRARTVSFGNFTIPVPGLHGGTGSVFRIQGTQSAKQLIQLQALDAGPPPSGLGIEILRVQ